MIQKNELFDAVLALPQDDRAELADRLLESLGETDRREVDDAWAAEVEARLRAFAEGRTRVVPSEEVFRTLNPSRP